MALQEVVIWVSTPGKRNSIFLQAQLMQQALARAGRRAIVCHPGGDSVLGNLKRVWRSDAVVWHYSSMDPWLLPFVFKRRLAVLYHNITPARFFVGSEPLVALRAALGRLQLRLMPGRWRYGAVSEYNRRELAAMRRCDVELVPCLVTSALGSLPEKSASPTLFFAGRIVENKNCIVLVEQVERAARRLGMRLRLVILGDGNPARGYFKRFARMLERVRDNGHLEVEWIRSGVDDAALDAFYASSWLYVSTSLHEGFGLPVCEAVARGTPALYLACGGTESVLAGEGCLPAPDAASFHESVERLLASADAREALLARQREALAGFVVPAAEARTSAAVAELVGSPA